MERSSWIPHRGSLVVDRSSWIARRGSIILDRSSCDRPTFAGRATPIGTVGACALGSCVRKNVDQGVDLSALYIILL